MPPIIWDKPGDRTYESGLDRGVLYTRDGNAVPWNGLISVTEQFEKESSPVYFDGMKINNLVSIGDFSASLTAVTYPDEFIEIEGADYLRRGFIASDQMGQTFGLSYRTRVGNDVDGEIASYKIHVLFNLTAIPSEKTYASVSNDPSIVEFQWDIKGVPEEVLGVPGFRPTAHFVIESDSFDPWLLEDLEKILYGSATSAPSLPSLQEFAEYMNDWCRVYVIDNNDGTWTAIEGRPGFFTINIDGSFEMTRVKASYSSDVEYILSSTTDLDDVPRIGIEDRGDGTWRAGSDEDGLLEDLGDGTFVIHDAEIAFDTPEQYRLSDTFYDRV